MCRNRLFGVSGGSSLQLSLASGMKPLLRISSSSVVSPLPSFSSTLIFIIARDLGSATHCKDKDAERVGLATKKTVQHRVHLLELAAIKEALDDARTAKEEAARRRTTAAAEDPDVLQSSCFETCTAKVLNGSVRAGHRVLKSSGIHPASPETCALVASKLIVGAEASTLASKPGLRRKARMAKAPRISPKHVSDAVEDMPDSRAPGCAGWRNSRRKSVIAEEPGLRALAGWAQL